MLTLASLKTMRHEYAASVEVRRAGSISDQVWVYQASVVRVDGTRHAGAVLTGFFAVDPLCGHTQDQMAEEGRSGALASDFVDHQRALHSPPPRKLLGMERIEGAKGGEAQLLIHEMIEVFAVPSGACIIASGRRESDRREYALYGLKAMRWEPEAWTLPPRYSPDYHKDGTSTREWLIGLAACGKRSKMK